MSNTVKTAVSIPKPLFEQAERLAEELKMSRSHLFGMALEAFIASYQNKMLLEAINQVYTETPPASAGSEEERETLRLSRMRKSQRRLLEGEW